MLPLRRPCGAPQDAFALLRDLSIRERELLQLQAALEGREAALAAAAATVARLQDAHAAQSDQLAEAQSELRLAQAEAQHNRQQARSSGGAASSSGGCVPRAAAASGGRCTDASHAHLQAEVQLHAELQALSEQQLAVLKQQLAESALEVQRLQQQLQWQQAGEHVRSGQRTQAEHPQRQAATGEAGTSQAGAYVHSEEVCALLHALGAPTCRHTPSAACSVAVTWF